MNDTSLLFKWVASFLIAIIIAFASVIWANLTSQISELGKQLSNTQKELVETKLSLMKLENRMDIVLEKLTEGSTARSRGLR